MASVGRFKKGLAVVLATLMIFTMLPGGLLKAKAAESDKTTLSIGDGSIIIGDGTVTQNGVSLTYNANGYIITGSGTTSNTISVTGGTQNITLSGVAINVSSTSDACAFCIAAGASVNLTLSGENSLASGRDCADINVPQNVELSIFGTDADKLMATGGDFSAGIGGNYHSLLGKITINGGNIRATSVSATGIGGGGERSIEKVIINGGNINASSKSRDAIGSGSKRTSYANVVINGGNINAKFRLIPKNGSGKYVYLTTVTLPTAVTAPVSSLSVKQGDIQVSYGINDMKSDGSGKLQLYLPANSFTTTADLTAGGTTYSNYYGTVSAGNSNVLKMDQDAFSVSTDKGSYIYGEEITVSQSGGSVSGTPDYTYYDITTANQLAGKPSDVGSFKVSTTLSGNASYYDTTATANFKITPKSIKFHNIKRQRIYHQRRHNQQDLWRQRLYAADNQTSEL